jgi:hypothetical protein
MARTSVEISEKYITRGEWAAIEFWAAQILAVSSFVLNLPSFFNRSTL